MARVACHVENKIYYKEFLPRSPIEKLKAMVKGSRATRARLNSEALLKAGFEAPKSLAWGPLPGGREYLITNTVAGAGVTQWLRSKLATRDPQNLLLRRQLLKQLGVFIGRLHATGFVHGDLRTSNVLAALRGDSFHFALIDNERNVFHRPAAGRAVSRNLMQLNMLPPAELSLSDRMRFFHNWRRQMRDLSTLEANLVGVESYQWAARRLRKKGKM
jgi:tRNA A-37 threonylcarbamoyl transferase component Bud32